MRFWLAVAVTAIAALARADAGQITLGELPAEASQTLRLIRQNGPFPFQRDGAVFVNREGRLPSRSRGYYREYTVKTPGAHERGARRIIAGRGGEYYYSDDHYRSFRRIIE
ncbi:MAG TPA: ribonuclease domain-containing protein [Burkholderiales bacterium]|nr:ribonuclease domain-containing protein [Burkholderiales bacterium]